MYAEWFFWVHSFDEGSKVSRYDGLKQVEKTLGRKPIELEQEPQLSMECRQIWNIAASMCEASYVEIKAYCDLTGDNLSQWEIEAIMTVSSVRKYPKDWRPDVK